MNDKNIIVARTLTYAGVLPFLLLAATVITDIHGYDYRPALLAYGAVIISFLCGIHWGVFLFFAEKCGSNLFMQSNAVALLAWSSCLLSWSRLSIGIQIGCFLYLLWLDYGLTKNKVLPDWFFKLRQQATAAVSIILATVAVSG